jgi:hypothetical protein
VQPVGATVTLLELLARSAGYTATMDNTTNLSWTGTLYATIGTYFGATWNSAALTLTPVGTMTWTAQTVETGVLTYVVKGVMVTKDVVRQALVLDDYSGTYLAAVHVAVTGCTNPANDIPPADIPLITISVAQTGSSATVTFSDFGLTLTFSGTLGQSGQFGSLLGTYSDSTGEVGNFSISAMNVQLNSLTASFSQSSTNDGCQSAGYFAGMRSQQ